MPSLLENVDPDGLLEYSVVYTDRSVNHMSLQFQTVMTDISRNLKQVYNADSVVIVPGGGTYGMEAVARQFATNKKCLVIRNGWFSYRWTQIFEAGKIPKSTKVLKAFRKNKENQEPFYPTNIEEVINTIAKEKPDLVFAPHVETASGMILPDDYLIQITNATHAVGGLFIIDCIASGAMWLNMKNIGIDILITAPQKGWSGPPCAAFIMLNNKAKKIISSSKSSSFSCSLEKWLEIMEIYENGGHAYHATMPTNSLIQCCNVINETRNYGLEAMKSNQIRLGKEVRSLFSELGIKSVAGAGFQAPTVIVSYTDNPDIKSGQKFAEHGLQIAAGVPLMCDEGDNFNTFRIGLFGLEKINNIKRTVTYLSDVLNKIL